MTSIATPRSELAHRSTDGIDVSLYWSKLTGRVTIELIDDRIGEHLELDVAPEHALDAFYHPYTYALAQAPDIVGTREALRR